MDKRALDKLTTNHYRALKALYDCRAKTPDGVVIIPVTQKQMAKVLKVSSPTMVSIFRSLTEDGLISREGNRRGVYYMTRDGERVVQCFEAVVEGGSTEDE